jgi:hypothetical protein
MAAFLFARGLNRTEEFRLASNLDGAGVFDDLVFKYRLKERDVWKTCFIQLKHKKNGGKIKRSCLKQISGDFSLFKYFQSYCEIKKNAATNPNLKKCGLFDDFEFVIYTNGSMKSNSQLQGGISDPLSILSSEEDSGKYLTFNKNQDKDIFEFFEKISKVYEGIRKKGKLEKEESELYRNVKKTVEMIQNSAPNIKEFKILDILKSEQNTDYVTMSTEEEEKCDFTLVEEFLSKVKIFQNQTNEKFFKGLIVKELQKACIATQSVANFIYTKFEEGFLEWWEKDNEALWLNENSNQWHAVQNCIITEIKEMSKHEIKGIDGCVESFSQQQVQKLSHDIEENTVLNIETNLKTSLKKKIYQSLNNLKYKNSLFIVMKPEFLPRFELKNLWPCKWSEVLVVDCDSENMAQTVLKRLEKPADCAKGLGSFMESKAEPLFNVLQKHQQKFILISPRIKASGFQQELRYIYKQLEENF